MYRLSDIVIGDYPISEFFGANPATYSARYNIKGYPGIRFKCPTRTPILAGAAGYVLETGMEEAGKGKFITLVHDNIDQGFLTTYGHLNDILVQKGERVSSGQLIAHSNQSGLAEYPCLYFGIAPCDSAGTKSLDNGYGGYIDPMGNDVEWDIKNLTEPLTKAEAAQQITISSDEYSILNAQAANYRIILNFLKAQTMFDDYLKEQSRAPINLQANPSDPEGGHAAVLYLSSVADDVDELDRELEEMRTKVDGTDESNKKEIQFPKDPIQPEMPLVKKPNLFIRFMHGIKRFIFKSNANI